MTTPPPAAPTARLGRYRLVRTLSRGGPETVHEAVAEPEGAAVTITLLAPLDGPALERLRRDVVAARGLDHPGVVRLLDAGAADGAPFVVHELVRGARPLEQAWAGLSPLERARRVRDAARAAGAAHARGLAHRGLGLGDLLLDEAGRVRVGGFGLAWGDSSPAADARALAGLLERAAAPALAAVHRQGAEGRFADGEALARALDEALAATPAATSPSARLPAALGPGSRLGGFVLVAPLGAGGMGQVWRARDAALGREVALKVIPTSSGQERKQRALRELEAASRVRHDHVVAVHAAGEGPGCLFLAMDLVEGQPLDRLLASGPLAPARAAELVAGVARALEALHVEGIVHRDIKPSNVLVGQDGAPRLTDFGVAHVVDADRLTRTNQLLGTPHYMSPEQLDGRGVDARADVFALGAVLYEALTGQLPHQAESLVELAMAKQRPPAPPSSRRPGLDPALDAICLHALALAPERRYPTARALADDLERFRSGERVSAPARRRGPAPLPLVAGALLALLGAGALAALGRDRQPAGARLDAWRRELEARAAATPRLAALDLGDLPARAAALPDGRDPAAPGARAALQVWFDLHALARGEAPHGDSPAPPDSPAAHALAGGRAALAGDPAAALAALEAAAAGGLRFVELDGWRYRALAARGVEDRLEAQALLLELPRALRAGVDPDAAARLEVVCQAEQGRPAEAAAALARVASPDDALRWTVAVLEAAEHVGAGRVVEANALLRGLSRPARPPRPREAETARRALELVLPMARTAASELRVLRSAERASLAAALELQARLTPGAAPAGEDRAVLLAVCVHTSTLASAPGLVLALAELCPGDAEVQLLATETLGEGEVTAEESRRAVAVARRALTTADAKGCARARVVLVRHLLDLGHLDEAAAELDVVERELSGAGPPGFEPTDLPVFRGLARLLAARLADRRGDADGALRALAAARELPELVPGDRALLRFEVLARQGRADAQLVAAREYAAAPVQVGPRRKLLATQVWRIFVARRLWAELRTFLEDLVEAQRLDDGPWRPRLALACAADGQLAHAADVLAGHTTEAVQALPPGVLTGLRAGDPAAVAALARALAEDPAAFARPPEARR